MPRRQVHKRSSFRCPDLCFSQFHLDHSGLVVNGLVGIGAKIHDNLMDFRGIGLNGYIFQSDLV